MDTYFSMATQSVGLQVLETVHIIATTKNFETLKGRYELLLERIKTLREGENNPQYLGDMNFSVNAYKRLYNGRPIESFELASVLKPCDFNAQNFYCDSIVGCINKYAEEKINEITLLKSENAKAKRKTKIIEKVYLAKEELQNRCSSASSYSTALNEIENLLKKIT
jgi:hypothetical protein